MSRDSDREDRRRRIAEAVCALADEHGMDGVTLRDVATRADVSMGAVQRCFRTKDEMLVFVLRHVGTRVTERVQDGLGGAPTGDLAHAVGEIALLGDEHRTEARVWLAFVARAAVSPPLAEVLRGSYRELTSLIERLVIALGVPDARVEAQALLALADGLTTHVLVGHLDQDAATKILRAYLAQLTA
ncbi:TetR/AcrR family transcriptional regulator [Actinoplanes oblitus]|uniref:TetR/AcrR family transcriptional regulator n=1 Tax=Actinoplanes oblitus TaxID=3040509 RepID=A0ABY8W4M3_9ACTN|nr:TetR/AcrR family transcriptional regulator [Actinoplanes oblitus]WIM92786.1 TetR/AcrR family transcriptional regulator [Actinoplanes oblitus]